MEKFALRTLSQGFCKECGSRLVQAENEIVCRRCGLVDQERTYDLIIENALASENVPFKNSSLGERYHLLDGTGSFIDYSNALYFHEGSGRPLPSPSQRLFLRLKTVYDKQVRFHDKGTDYRTLCSLNRVAANLGVSSIIRDRSAYLYRKAMKKVRGIVPSPLVAAYCLLYATRESRDSYPLTIQEVVKAFKMVGHRVSAPAIIKVGFHCREVFGGPLRVRGSEEFLRRIVERVISDKEIATTMKDMGMNPHRFKGKLLRFSSRLLGSLTRDKCGRNPYTLAVSSIYAAEKILARKEGRRLIFTQRSLARAASVAEYSIREHFCKFFKKII